MRRLLPLLPLLGLLALAACGSAGRDPIVREGMGAISGLWGGGKPAAGGKPPRAITRQEIVKQDVAAIQARLATDKSPTLMYAASSNGGFVTYMSALRQQVTLHGGAAITGTRGLGWDLLSAWTEDRDPLVSPTPPGSWPQGVRRVYQFRGLNGPQGTVLTYDCRFELPGKPAQMTILQVRYTGVEISETCVGPHDTFENLHFVDASGTVWRSLQWVGPQMPLLDVQILLPYTGD